MAVLDDTSLTMNAVGYHHHPRHHCHRLGHGYGLGHGHHLGHHCHRFGHGHGRGLAWL